MDCKISSQTKATMTYHKIHIKRKSFDFNIENDAYIIEKLNSVDSKAIYIKQLIRNDIKKERNK